MESFICLLQKLVQRLNAMKLAVSNKSSLKKLDSYGLKFDTQLKEMQEMQTKLIANPEESKVEHSDGTFKIVLDNIDLRITTRDMTSDRQNRDIHWVNHSAIKNRVTLGNRKGTQPELSQLDNCLLLPTAADHENLRKDFTHLVSRVLVEHLPCMEFLQSVCVKHIPHQYNKTMAQKSEKVHVNRKVSSHPVDDHFWKNKINIKD